MTEKIANLAACAPSLRQDFWNYYLPEERDKIQKHMFRQAQSILDSINEGNTDALELAKMIYDHPVLKGTHSKKLEEATMQMKDFFENSIKFIRDEIKGEIDG